MTPRRSGLPHLGLMLILPPLVYYMWMCMRFHGGALILPDSAAALRALLSRVPPPTRTAVLLYGGWMLLQAALQIHVPGPLVPGTPLSDGTRLSYRMNGWVSFWSTLVLALLLVVLRVVPATVLYDQLGPLLTVANLFACALALWVYFVGKASGERGSGSPISDYFLGTALNPRSGGFDYKLFCEARPGLILWVLIDLSLAAKQQALHGTVTTPMLLLCLFQFLYVADYFYYEEAILTTWDIQHERFGWMLCWGSLVWVPFTYTLQAQYLVHHPHELPIWAAGLLVGLNLLGYVLFRGANLQKHRFRTDPGRPLWGRRPAYIRTARGSLLLTSGFWGLARHINYLGDLLMGLAFCLLCGFAHLLPYFYIIYFTILLVHRERRDSHACHRKYGPDWEEYCHKVRWRILPGIY